MEKKKLNIKDLSWEEIKILCDEVGLPNFRAEQIWRGLYQNLATSADELTLLSLDERSLLADYYEFLTVEKFKKFVSIDGSVKLLTELKDGTKIESVFMPWHNDDGHIERTTLCVSSQVGCGLDCKFCATGTMGLTRNLKASEIIDQVILAEKELNLRISNIVFMGMGEPLLNYNNVVKTIKNLSSGPFQKLNPKRITVSTSGVISGIKKLGNLDRPVKLALSLHATTNGVRDKIIPLNLKTQLKPLLAEIDQYYRKTKLPVTYEYIPFDGINDTYDDAKRLAKVAKRVPSRVNLIPFNDISFTEPTGISAQLKPTSMERVYQFAEIIRKYGGVVTIRDTFGKDIDAACGQLALSEKES